MEDEQMTDNIFDGYLSRKTLFQNKEFLRHNYNPNSLPHRKNEIDTLSFNLVEALQGHIPSNMTLYGVTGAGKTAVTNYVCSQTRSARSTRPTRSPRRRRPCRQDRPGCFVLGKGCPNR